MTDDATCPGCEFVPPYGTLAEWDHVYGEANCQVMAGLRATIAALRAERNDLLGILRHFTEATDHGPCPPNPNPVYDCELCMALDDARAALNHQEEA